MVFLSINQMPRAKRLSSKDNWFRRIQFLEMHHIINSCTNMSKIYGNKDAKSCTTWSFPSYREEEIHWETCWHVWQICRVINSLNADTATLLDFTKIVPREFHVWFRSCQFLIFPLVWMAPWLNFRIPVHLLASHWIRIATIVIYLVLQSAPTNVNGVDGYSEVAPITHRTGYWFEEGWCSIYQVNICTIVSFYCVKSIVLLCKE